MKRFNAAKDPSRLVPVVEFRHDGGVAMLMFQPSQIVWEFKIQGEQGFIEMRAHVTRGGHLRVLPKPSCIAASSSSPSLPIRTTIWNTYNGLPPPSNILACSRKPTSLRFPVLVITVLHCSQYPNKVHPLYICARIGGDASRMTRGSSLSRGR